MTTPLKLLAWCAFLAFLSHLTTTYATKPQIQAFRGQEQASTATSITDMAGIKGEKRNVRITYYGWTGFPMANGELPHWGAVAISDRTVPLGTIVYADTKFICGRFTVKDRTAQWVNDKFDLPTIDIYMPLPKEELRKLGTYKTDVYLIN